MDLTADQKFAKWLLEEFGPTIHFPIEIFEIKKIPPIPGRVFTQRFKLTTAEYDGTGNNPHNFRCMVVHVLQDEPENNVFIAGDDCTQAPDF